MIGMLGAGRALGSRIHPNAECALSAGMTPEWIVRNTGIEQRRYVKEGETVLSLALDASRKAIDVAGTSDIDLTIVATFSHDYTFPAASAGLHAALGFHGGMFFDIQANCSGFVDALIVATALMERDLTIRHALVVGAEVASPFIDPRDAGTAPFFADGAGAVVLRRTTKGYVSSATWTDSTGYEAVRCKRGVPMEQIGSATGRFALQHLPRTVLQAMGKAGWAVADVDTFIFHQASLRLVEFIAGTLRVPMHKTFNNVQMIGNTGAASVPIAIADAWPLHGKVVFAGVGAGFGFAASCWEME
jgi:3-oxoacyl-[acyl-carrier-protein] synthase III